MMDLTGSMSGDETLFMRADIMEHAWRIVQPVLDAWEDAGQLPIYPSGASGPTEEDALSARGGRTWRPVNDTGVGESS
jgi:glucose-6-phosphate 1-dehydrogenase